jgi:4-hydroxy-3-polyprenylbenzoate decarboxylase
MAYKSLRECVDDLERHGHLVRIRTELDPDLEMAEVHRRVFDKGGPAIFFEKVKGSPFPAVSNLYGTFERTDFLFRKTFDRVQRVIELKADPANFLSNPARYLSTPFTALSALPFRKRSRLASMYGRTTLSQLPQIKSWPMDGGAFITLPQVFTLPPGSRKAMQSNLGMYRIQISGNQYTPDREAGMHYQLHRGIGVHHSQYNETEEPFRVSIFVGGPPSHAFAAVMPLPEGLSELTFAGLLGGRRFRYGWHDGHFISSDADFVITGIIRKDIKKPEGPFGDHLGYYSLTHDFPVVEVKDVFFRKEAIWHFTVVGRPPQEDSSFGHLIHELVKPLTSGEFPGIRKINAVDAAGVHPLLLAIGSERYMPFREKRPEELLTQANHLLGKGQTSLAKFLIIAAAEDAPSLTTSDIPVFFTHVLQRVDWARDLHFYTNTTIDTLDYSGTGWNTGSKVVIACRGAVRRQLSSILPASLRLLPKFSAPRLVRPGILVIEGPAFTNYHDMSDIEELAATLDQHDLSGLPLVILTDDSEFLASRFDNFLWQTFTRANPSHDIHGVGSFTAHKHWGCTKSLIIDARAKPHHAPELVPDKKVAEKVDRLFRKGGELEKWG